MDSCHEYLPGWFVTTRIASYPMPLLQYRHDMGRDGEGSGGSQLPRGNSPTNKTIQGNLRLLLR